MQTHRGRPWEGRGWMMLPGAKNTWAPRCWKKWGAASPGAFGKSTALLAPCFRIFSVQIGDNASWWSEAAPLRYFVGAALGNQHIWGAHDPPQDIWERGGLPLPSPRGTHYREDDGELSAAGWGSSAQPPRPWGRGRHSSCPAPRHCPLTECPRRLPGPTVTGQVSAARWGAGRTGVLSEAGGCEPLLGRPCPWAARWSHQPPGVIRQQGPQSRLVYTPSKCNKGHSALSREVGVLSPEKWS